MGLYWFLMVYHGFIMGLSWVYHGFIMGLYWFIMVYHGFIMVYHGWSWFIMIYMLWNIMIIYNEIIWILSWFLTIFGGVEMHLLQWWREQFGPMYHHFGVIWWARLWRENRGLLLMPIWYSIYSGVLAHPQIDYRVMQWGMEDLSPVWVLIVFFVIWWALVWGFGD